MKEKILLQSLDLFSKKGFDAVSVSMISEGLGISKSALYKHYKSKRAIFEAILKRMDESGFKISKTFNVPDDIFDGLSEKYNKTQLKDLFTFTFAMFLYWTEDEFASRFRRMLSIEQFNSKEMSDYYQQYLVSCPLKYIKNIFSSMEGITICDVNPDQLALEFYSPVYMLINMSDGASTRIEYSKFLRSHFEIFLERIHASSSIKYPLSQKYCTPELMKLIMGPNPIKLAEELLENSFIKPGSAVCDLGCGKGLTSVFLAKEHKLKVYATDLWTDAEENARFFSSLGLDKENICAVKADAMALPFENEFFDAVVSIDSYNYFGRDPAFLDEKLLPFIKSGGYIYIAIPGMKEDCHDDLPYELLLSWNAEQLDFLHDKAYWRRIIEKSSDIEIISIKEMKSNKEVWNDWLALDNEYAAGDRKAMEAGAGKYLNFIQIILKKL